METLNEIKEHTAKDASLYEVVKVIQSGMPEKKEEVPHNISYHLP